MVVVLVLPVADDDLCVQQRVEAVDVEALVADPAVERLDVPVAPRRARRDVGQAGAGASPVGHRLAAPTVMLPPPSAMTADPIHLPGGVPSSV